MVEPALQVRVDVCNAMLAEALGAAATRTGWERTPSHTADSVLVTDRVSARPATSPPGNLTILVCDPTSYSARCALDAVADLLAAAVVCSDEPSDLVAALDALAVDRVSVPQRVLRLADDMPDLTERQLAVLGAVVAGQTNAEIGRGLYLSTASVKREMAVLYTALDAANRAGLAAAARELGLPPRPARP